ncbi:phosphotransferase family protein [Nocardioides terrisoli]|uniref:phosphotransferase family protein n=1 Tax=Nocardioides terrisoli TaxID=3388267 RepID=UPI00287BBDDE|nr:phosphotransferase family protein [Nocardioides marmorisolisilvae]
MVTTKTAAGIAEQLKALLAARAPDRGVTDISVESVEGGYSRTTWVATINWREGSMTTHILRSDPITDTGPFRTDRDREWQLLNALYEHSSLGIAEPQWYDEKADFFEAKCLVTDFVSGGTLQGLLTAGTDLKTGAKRLMRTLAAIHAVDTTKLLLDAPASWDDHIAGVIAFAERLASRAGSSLPVMGDVVGYLRHNIPEPAPLTLVHGDFQPANILLPPGGDPLVIDWEYARIGDPREDLGYYSIYPVPPNLYVEDADTVLEEYRKASGLSEAQVEPAAIDYFCVVSNLLYFQQIWEGVAALETGQHGVMSALLIGTLSHFNNQFSRIVRDRDHSLSVR